MNYKVIENQTFGEERALYNSNAIEVRNCKFEGIEDGESALKESKNLYITNCEFHLRYPLWHVTNCDFDRSKMFDTCRAPLWYSKNVSIKDSVLYGPKNVRECADISINNTDIVSSEFGWKTKSIRIDNSSLEGEYAFLDSRKIDLTNVKFKGKYSFQYVKNLKITDSIIDTKDAFWHVDNALIENSTIKGEYIGWYSKNLTFRNCTIEGTQPFCYCKNLKLENCIMNNCDLAFERSTVKATIVSHVESIKNPISGHIKVQSVGEIIDYSSKASKKGVIEVVNN